jgi:hypothetical protein
MLRRRGSGMAGVRWIAGREQVSGLSREAKTKKREWARQKGRSGSWDPWGNEQI